LLSAIGVQDTLADGMWVCRTHTLSAIGVQDTLADCLWVCRTQKCRSITIPPCPENKCMSCNMNRNKLTTSIQSILKVNGVYDMVMMDEIDAAPSTLVSICFVGDKLQK